ncbi:GGDEF domain-containing protein [Vibrio sinaloensis]|nr:GGDEF domain-containing protein [Vibrio sinaloensis]
MGDKLLECLSRKFEALLGEHDSVARFGGDEFIFCFPCVENQRHALDKTMAVKQVFADPLIIDGKLLTTDCSMGGGKHVP